MASHKKLQQLVTAMQLSLDVDFVALALADHRQTGLAKQIKWLFVSGNTNQRYKKIILREGRGLGGIVWRTGRTLIENDLSGKSSAILLDYPIAMVENLKSVGAVPIFSEELLVGVFVVGFRKTQPIRPELIAEVKVNNNRLAKLITQLSFGGERD